MKGAAGLGGLALLLATSALWNPARSQEVSLPDRVDPQLPAPVPVPFGPGELLTYKVKLGIFTVGEGHMQVVGLEAVRGAASYHVSMGIQGGVPFWRVDDLLQSWIGVHDLVSRRFVKRQKEGRRQRFEDWEFFPDERRFRRMDKEREGEIPTSEPLDDVSFLYFARTLPLEVGAEYVLNRYYTERGNPVVLRVLRRDTVDVPAGRFPTVVVRPIIQTDGLFGEGGKAEVHFTDDSRRLMVYMKASVPVMGSLSLDLDAITEGHPLSTPGRTADGPGHLDSDRSGGPPSPLIHRVFNSILAPPSRERWNE